MDRKYRQSGYMDRDRDRDKDRDRNRERYRERGPKLHRPEFRSPMMPGFHEVIRCSACGTPLPSIRYEIQYETKCPKCSADLHVCKNCVYFDTSSRLECRQPITQRVPRKDVSNTCTYFEARRTVERQTGSTPANQSRPEPEDPRAAFERLFKK